VKDEEYGEDKDPLLVRPFLLHDEGSVGDQSRQTWPSATTREVRSQRALDGADDPTAIIELPGDPATSASQPRHARPTPPRPMRSWSTRHRRLLVLTSAASIVLVSATAAGYAALRSDVRPLTSAAQPADPLPAVTGPQTTGVPTPTSATPSSGRPAAGTTANPRTSPSASVGTTAPTAAAPSPAGTSAPATNDKPTVAPAPPEYGLAPEPASERMGTIRGQNGLCLDLNGGVPADDNHLQVYDCNGSSAQAWTLAADGTLRVSGKCALLVGDNTVRITSCDSRTTARWQISSQRLVNAANGGCLTDPSAGRASGTGVTVTGCTGSANQRWSLP
jgi:hypothetical protein